MDIGEQHRLARETTVSVCNLRIEEVGIKPTKVSERKILQNALASLLRAQILSGLPNLFKNTDTKRVSHSAKKLGTE